MHSAKVKFFGVFNPVYLFNVVVVVIDICGKSLITREWMYGITRTTHVNVSISVHFIVGITPFLKLVFLHCSLFMF